MATHDKHDTHQKALSLNLDPTIFGSFAEIGAGQEVARWFLRVGAASGTVAKTISAYDKEVSDDLYGGGTRYVSKPRLKAMLDGEWKQLLAQLGPSRGANTKFFSFVDTVSARNYAGTNDCHGWVGLRFQREPGGAANNAILHINLRDTTNVHQQEAVGILGVNLIFAVHRAAGSPTEFIASAFDDLSLHRIEIDCLELSGPAFEGWDRDEVHALLVATGYAEAVAYSADDQLVPANELLYKRALVLAPGRFDHVDQMHADLISDTLAVLPPEELKESKGGLGLFCLSIPQDPKNEEVPVKKIIHHVKELQKLGYGVMVFRAQELYSMSAYVNRYTKSRVHFAIGLTVLVRVLQDRYNDLAGTLLEGVARLFTQNVRLTVYPMLVDVTQRRATLAGLSGWTWKETDGVVTVDNLHPVGALNSLYEYLLKSELILPGKPAHSREAAQG